MSISKNANVENCVISVDRSGELAIGSGSVIRGRISVGPGSSVSIGRDVICNRNVFIRAWEGSSITIGDGCLLSDVVVETSDMHSIVSIETNERLNPSEDVVIEGNCWLASQVLVLGGAKIGYGSAVGARSLVNKKFGQNVLLVGSPAKVAKENITWRRDKL